MTKQRSFKLSCEGKIPFESFAIAENALKRTKARKCGGNVYHCDYCRKYHIGTRPSFIKKSKDNPRILLRQNAEY